MDPDETIRELTSGDAFGVRLTPSRASTPSAATGVQRTVTEDCQFVCVAQAGYFRVMPQAADAEVPELEGGEEEDGKNGGSVVLVYEKVKKETAVDSASRLVIKVGGKTSRF